MTLIPRNNFLPLTSSNPSFLHNPCEAELNGQKQENTKHSLQKRNSLTRHLDTTTTGRQHDNMRKRIMNSKAHNLLFHEGVADQHHGSHACFQNVKTKLSRSVKVQNPCPIFLFHKIKPDVSSICTSKLTHNCTMSPNSAQKGKITNTCS